MSPNLLIYALPMSRGGGLKQVNLVNFFWQVDSISIKGTFSGYKNEKPKKMRFNPPHLTLSFWKILQVSKISVGPEKFSYWKALKKNLCKFFENYLSPSKDDLQKVIFAWT